MWYRPSGLPVTAGLKACTTADFSQALKADVTNVSEYVVKLRGFEVHDESQSLEGIGALDGSTLLVIARRRRPVR